MHHAPHKPIKREFPDAFPGVSQAQGSEKLDNQGQTKKLKFEDVVDPSKKVELTDLVDSPALKTSEENHKTPLNFVVLPPPMFVIDKQSIYQFNWILDDIYKNKIPISKYKFQVCIIVNVASRSGFTHSNYNMLTELHKRYAARHGLSILAFPCNQFGGQEPGNSANIREFCQKKNVEFDVFRKINVNGRDAHPLWLYLQAIIEGPREHRIMWNFTKFVVNRSGVPVARFNSLASEMPKLIECLERLW